MLKPVLKPSTTDRLKRQRVILTWLQLVHAIKNRDASQLNDVHCSRKLERSDLIEIFCHSDCQNVIPDGIDNTLLKCT